MAWQSQFHGGTGKSHAGFHRLGTDHRAVNHKDIKERRKASMTYPATTTSTSSRRKWLTTSVTLLAASALPFAATAAAPTPLEVWKDPNCGCCQDWVDHLQANGFAVKVHATGNNAVRARLGLPQKLGSCHTALVGGYVVEGHVPASDVRALLQQKPKALGLAVPGMPVGSPGMDGPAYGDRRDPYDVLLVARDGSTRVFKSYNKKAST